MKMEETVFRNDLWRWNRQCSETTYEDRRDSVPKRPMKMEETECSETTYEAGRGRVFRNDLWRWKRQSVPKRPMKMEATECYETTYEDGIDRVFRNDLWRWKRQSVPKRRHIKFRRWRVSSTRKNTTFGTWRKLEIKNIMGNFLTSENWRKKAECLQVTRSCCAVECDHVC